MMLSVPAISIHLPSVRRALLALDGSLALAVGGWAAAEPPTRAARLGYISGTVSFLPGSQPDWVRAVVNRPLTTGDRLWVDANSRAELQIGGAAIRLGASTSMTLLNLDDRIAQIKVSQGSLIVRVRRIGPNQAFEIDTPNLAFTLRQAGDYRIDVDPYGDATAVMVQRGRGEVYGEGASYTVGPRQGYRFYGTSLTDYEPLAARREDEFDRWARSRDRRDDNSPSARYVSPQVVGYQDLDNNGSWRRDPDYGNVWTPNRVATGWTPYRDGHWAWVDPWGWTWVDDAPWGYAVSHYGRWVNRSGAWGWVPGPMREQAVYAPALVAFVGGDNFRATPVAVGTARPTVGWFPLAPREVYQPSYSVSRGYFDNINRSNTVIAPAAITNVYNTSVANSTTPIKNNTSNVPRIVYVNQQVAGAVVAVPVQAFVQSQPVAKAALAVSREAAVAALVAHVAAVAPVRQSVQGGAGVAGALPPARERAVVARTAPPPAPVAFAAQQQQLAARPGAPIDEAQRKQLKPAAAAAPTVSVVTTAQAPAPTAPPPATSPAGKTTEERKADAARSNAATNDALRADPGKADAAKVAGDRAEALKGEAAKADAAKAAAARSAAAKAEAARIESAKAEAAKAEAAKADAAKAEAARAAAAKTEAARLEAAKLEAAKAEAAKAEASKTGTAKTEAPKAAAARADAAKAEEARVASAKAAAAATSPPVAQPPQRGEPPERGERSERPPGKARPPVPKPAPDARADDESGRTKADEETRRR